MKAFVLKHYGGPQGSDFAEMPRPQPGAGEVLVRMHSAGLNPVDYKIRQGKLWPIYRPKLPVVMGNELAGTVVELGTEAKRFTIGEQIFVRGHKAELGAFAEFARVPEELAAKVPSALDFDHAGGVPLAGLTALQALRDELHVKPGMRLLITGGTGGVGTFAIQLAKLMGAEVSVTCSEAGRALAESLGADRVIDYKTERLDDAVKAVDSVLDLVGGATLRECFRVVKPGGKIVSIAGTPEPNTARKDIAPAFGLKALFWVASFRLRWLARRRRVQYRYYFMHGSGSDLAELAVLIEQGKLRVVVDRVFEFEKIAEAFAYLEEGHAKGKVVVRME
jgi:NADPH:quinone reductase-like Zn-dependent oxidoreductase